jgi:hypothetical protein
MDRPPIQDALERRLEMALLDEATQRNALQDAQSNTRRNEIRNAQREAAQRHRDALVGGFPDEVVEQIEEFEGVDEGPRANALPPREHTRTRAQATDDGLARALRQRMAHTNSRAARNLILPGSPDEANVRREYREIISQFIRGRRPDWPARGVNSMADAMAQRWSADMSHEQRLELMHDVIRLGGY